MAFQMEYENALDELFSSSSPGFIGINSKILKSLLEICIPILQIPFDECLNLKIMKIYIIELHRITNEINVNKGFTFNRIIFKFQNNHFKKFKT
ncbi:hypothetical protein BpHYR1_040063 [Brachionus plicatilis]|uniref:Uncharacterized protein n=1 Tax=Brachionus plicatilis TaxID=10195 RepID=A0A3M7QL92_BRAPC|nr:hypothetical protein BpHYR1_040063 [Brachionus plicatilis]